MSGDEFVLAKSEIDIDIGPESSLVQTGFRLSAQLPHDLHGEQRTRRQSVIERCEQNNFN
jgi:hypothetical protein